MDELAVSSSSFPRKREPSDVDVNQAKSLGSRFRGNDVLLRFRGNDAVFRFRGKDVLLRFRGNDVLLRTRGNGG